MKNNYEVRGNVTAVFLSSQKYGCMETLIDTDDLDKVKGFANTWFPAWDKGAKSFYVCGNYTKENHKRTVIRLHRWLFDLSDSKVFVDHKDHNTLNNTRNNLSVVSNCENQQNRRIQINNKSGYAGVCWVERFNRWLVSIRVNGTRKHVGLFTNLEEAIKARQNAEIKYFQYGKQN
ncbi:hypothetical protein CHR53_07060 [Neobacillus mesonae]|uniref:HNH nuclease domain-containing protein n=1 Tax=Neobacillus mesonae TaxID=1193713 RepID=A0A3Q9QXG6_9BACI|nr:hypothetical protein CHR53_07060 [Neobacillus mesonae]